MSTALSHWRRRWEGGDPGVANQKSPTCLLLTPELRFHSFGFAARDFYHDLDPEEARHWLYFDKFKMKIHSTSVRLKPRQSSYKCIYIKNIQQAIKSVLRSLEVQ